MCKTEPDPSRFTSHLSLLTFHLSPLPSHVSPLTLHPSRLTLHPSPLTLHPSRFTSHLSLLTLHLSRLTLHLMISIIIPAYNAADTIVEALESVLAQSLWAKATIDRRPQTIGREKNNYETRERPEKGDGGSPLAKTVDHRSETLDQEAEKSIEQKSQRTPREESCISAGGGEEKSSLRSSRLSVKQSSSSKSDVSGLMSEVSPQYEVIIVDDCSTDNTVEVVRKWITSHPSHFTLHVLPVNVGPAAARNRGIREAKGEWIAFLDADDIWMPHKLEVQMQLATEYPEVVLWCGGSIRFQGKRMETADYRLQTTERGRRTTTKDAKGTKTKETGKDIDMDEQDGQEGRRKGLQTKDYKQQLSCVSCPSMLDLTSLALKGEGLPLTSHLSPITLQDLATHNPIGCSTVLVRKAVLEAVGGFDEQFCGPEDYELWMRIAAYAPQTTDYRLQTTDMGKQTTDHRQQTTDMGRDLTTKNTKGTKGMGGRAEGEEERAEGEGQGAASGGGRAEGGKPETRCSGGDTDHAPCTIHHSLPVAHVSRLPPHPSPLPPHPSPLTLHVPPDPSPLTLCSAPLTFHRIRLGSLSMDDRTFLPQVMRVLDKAYGPGGVLEAFQSFKRAAISNQYWGGTWMALSRGARVMAMRLVWHSWWSQRCGAFVVKRPWLKTVLLLLLWRSDRVTTGLQTGRRCGNMGKLPRNSG